MKTRVALLSLIVMIVLSRTVAAHHEAQHRPPPMLREVGFDQRLGAGIPLDLKFRDEVGRSVRLGDYFGTQPVILTMAYYNCPMLCSLVLDGLVQSLRRLPFEVGEHFTVVTISIDPDETPAQASAKKSQALQRYGHPQAAAAWHFLTGDQVSIRHLAEAVGFRYVYDAEIQQFAHAAGLVVLTPQGGIARYVYGIEFPPRALRLALTEAAAGQIGSAVDQLLLFCYRYDPTTGQYGLVIINVLRLTGLITVAALGGFVGLMFRRERRRVEG